jgi:hypothetical protein
MYPTGYLNAQRAQTYGFGGFADGSQDQLQGARPIPTTSNAPIQPTQSPLLPRQHSHHKPHPSVGQAQRRSSGTKSDHRNEAHVPVRRRISRACDQCNQLRTKCDGGNPCSHCVGRFKYVHCNFRYLANTFKSSNSHASTFGNGKSEGRHLVKTSLSSKYRLPYKTSTPLLQRIIRPRTQARPQTSRTKENLLNLSPTTLLLRDHLHLRFPSKQ